MMDSRRYKRLKCTDCKCGSGDIKREEKVSLLSQDFEANGSSGF